MKHWSLGWCGALLCALLWNVGMLLGVAICLFHGGGNIHLEARGPETMSAIEVLAFVGGFGSSVACLARVLIDDWRRL